jgi:hypothetical protein
VASRRSSTPGRSSWSPTTPTPRSSGRSRSRRR